jgi:hypothetical protein
MMSALCNHGQGGVADTIPPCLFCGAPEFVEIHEIWGHEFMLRTCCESLIWTVKLGSKLTRRFTSSSMVGNGGTAARLLSGGNAVKQTPGYGSLWPSNEQKSPKTARRTCYKTRSKMNV